MDENIVFLDEVPVVQRIDEKELDKLVLPDWDLLPPFEGIDRGEVND